MSESLMTTRDALAVALEAHRGPSIMEWGYICSCGHNADRFKGHWRHVAESLPVLDAATLADDETVIRRVGDAIYGEHNGIDFAAHGIPRQTVQLGLQALAVALAERG